MQLTHKMIKIALIQFKTKRHKFDLYTLLPSSDFRHTTQPTSRLNNKILYLHVILKPRGATPVTYSHQCAAVM